MKRKLVFVSFLIFSSILFILYTISTSATTQPPQPASGSDEGAIEQAVMEAIQGEREYVLAYLVYDIQVSRVEIVEDGSQAVAYLETIDPETDEVIPSEPGIVIAIRENSSWRIILPSDPEWLDYVNTFPEEIITAEYRVSLEEMASAQLATAGSAYGGYLLPWEAGKVVYLSRSVAHDESFQSGHFAFDFYIPNTHYRLHASKAGTVWRARWDVPNDNHSDMGNYLVLEDTTTTPTTYQLYLHLAQDSIPIDLRTEGSYVNQGQFIGNADNTGKSSGDHLHFHVHTNPYSYWGTAIDITFDDVDINGGRPRTSYDKPFCKSSDVCDTFRSFYVSGNVVHGDRTPPSADLFGPSTGTHVTSPTLHIEGWASDADSGIDFGTLIANFDNQWQEVGEPFTETTFSMDWDVCADDVPDGPFSLAVRAWDRAGNPTTGLPGLTHLIKDHPCKPIIPQCIPAGDQIAIYSETDFRGDCQVVNAGVYPDDSHFNLVGNDNIESILVGEEIYAHLFAEPNFSGRSSTLWTDDANLADNPLGNNTISSIRVTSRDDPAFTPTQLISPISGEEFPDDASIGYSWRDPGGATQFRVLVNGPGGEFRSPWISTPYWLPGGIEYIPGSYTWKVRARNCPQASCFSNWSAASDFTVSNSGPSLLSISAPFSEDMESGDSNWYATGMWNLLSDEDKSHTGMNSWYYGQPSKGDFNDGTPNSGDLTLRPVSIPGTGYILKFWYRYDTEEPANNYDQRWLQISANNEPFEYVLQLKNDEPGYWFQAALDLSPYAGQDVQIRFHFASLDDQFNSGEGWFIDDLVIDQFSLPSCSDSDDGPSGANLIELNQTGSGIICPSGDIDYYKFEGNAGDHIVLDVDTPTDKPVEGLDLYLFLLDNDGSSQLAEHDDEILGLKRDPHLGYQLGRTGTYYVRARLWSHPHYGGEEFTYNLTLLKDNSEPQGELTTPLSGTNLPVTTQFNLVVDATDNKSGISHVDFFYHSGNWLNSGWQLLGSDIDGSDGWTFSLDTSELVEQKDIAIAVKIHDWAGNWISRGAWNLVLDRTPPTTDLRSLAAEQGSTAIKLQWDGNDNLSGLDFHELQVKIDAGTWTDVNPTIPGEAVETWYIAQAGRDYGFRLRGVDRAGNQEAFPATAEAQTSIPTVQILCSAPDLWDDDSNDNSPEQSSVIDVGESSRVHNFCNPLSGDGLFDQDWMKFSVETGETYLIHSLPLTGMTASILELYAPDGSTLLAASQPDAFGESSQIIWKAEHDGQVYLRVRHMDGNVIGNDVLYRLAVTEFQEIYLPFLNR